MTSLGYVAPTVLSDEFMLNGLTVVGSLAGGGGLGDVDLIYVPEPATVLLVLLGVTGLVVAGHRRNDKTRSVTA